MKARFSSAEHGFCESCAPGSANDSLDAGM